MTAVSGEAAAAAATAQQAIRNFDEMYARLSFYMAFFSVSFELRSDYSPAWRTLAWYAFVGSNVLAWLYTCAVADSHDVIWHSCSMAPLLFQGLTKFHVYTHYIRDICECYAHVRRIYRLNCADTRNACNAAVLLRWSARIRLVVLNGWMLITLTAVVFLTMPALTYWLTAGQQLDPIIEMWLPGIDHRASWTGYAALYAYHSAMVAVTVMGTCGCDLTTFLLTMHAFPMAAVFGNLWREIDAAAQLAAGARGGSAGDRAALERRRRALFRTMLQQHRDIARFLCDMRRIYWVVTFCEVSSASAMLCMALYGFLVYGWPQAPLFAALIFSKLVLFSLIGTLLEIATDRVYARLLDNRWYCAGVPEQRLLCVALATAQRPALLMAGTMPLNMITCVETLKGVYSVGMLLLQ